MYENIDLSRFHEAHKRDYSTALEEIKRGRKVRHWMWYIFPQVSGLGKSAMSELYAIKSMEEAVAYLNDPVLGRNLVEISEALLETESSDPVYVMGRPDDIKLKSCMTLFSEISGEYGNVFDRVLDKFYNGKKCTRTLEFLFKS